MIVGPLADRKSKHHITDIHVDPDGPLPPASPDQSKQIEMLANRIRTARSNNATVMLAYGAHLVKNGLVSVVTRMMETGWITHLATNGAGVIHDWEYAFHGMSEEDVRTHVAQGCFGTWDETGRHTALAVLSGAVDGLGYGESMGRMIVEDGYQIPHHSQIQKALIDWSNDPEDNEGMPARAELLQTILRHNIASGRHTVEHPYRTYSLTGNAYRLKIPLTVHPSIGYDIVYTHPLVSGAAYGRAGIIDFHVFVEGVTRVDGGVFLSIGSSIMAPQVFEKAVSITNNLRRQNKLRPLLPFIAVNDLIEEDWDWNVGEPPIHNPAYYNRMGKSFSRMGGELTYTAADNRLFMLHLCRHLTR